MRGFRNFLARGDVVVAAVGLVVALALSGLIKAFTTAIISPLVNRAQGNHPIALGVLLGSAGSTSTLLDVGAFVSAVVYQNAPQCSRLQAGGEAAPPQRQDGVFCESM